MGCSFSGLNALYDSASGDVWINEHQFKIIRQLGEGGFAYVFLVKEVINNTSDGGVSKKIKDPSHISDDGTYAMKKVLIQNTEQLEFVKEEIRTSSLFSQRDGGRICGGRAAAVDAVKLDVRRWLQFSHFLSGFWCGE